MVKITIEQKIKNVTEELFKFARYQPRDELELVMYLFTAKNVAEVYDDMVDEPYTDRNYRMARLIEQYLREYPFYRVQRKDDL